jgi:hypothetical protein
LPLMILVLLRASNCSLMVGERRSKISISHLHIKKELIQLFYGPVTILTVA